MPVSRYLYGIYGILHYGVHAYILKRRASVARRNLYTSVDGASSSPVAVFVYILLNIIIIITVVVIYYFYKKYHDVMQRML